MDHLINFRVEPVPELHTYSVEVRFRRLKEEYPLNVDNAAARQRFLTDVWEWFLKPNCDQEPAVRRLGFALDLAVEDMRLRHGIPIVESMADLDHAEVQWLWPQVIPSGKLSLVIGDPGVGKSFVALDIAARVSQGFPWPHELREPAPGQPADVLLLSAEDDPHDTLLPRLNAQGADLRRISLFRGVDKSLGRQRKRLPFSLAMLDKLAESLDKLSDCRLVVIDPISAYLQCIDANRITDVRELLTPLAQLAHERQIAVLAVNHLNKNLAGPLIHRSLGSLAFAAAARAVWAVQRDSRDPERRVFLPVKNNLACDARALAFGLQQSCGFRAPTVYWQPKWFKMPDIPLPSDRSFMKTTGRRLRRELAIAWLRRQLASGQRPSSELLAAARLEHIAERTLRRAFHELGGAMWKEPAGHWVWMLPAPPGDENPLAPPAQLALEPGALIGPPVAVAKLAKLAADEPRVAGLPTPE